ncbi:MAG: tyrosine-type recombinase/integrase [Firmicutes bacterium]|nr:tyrosine-type recombinase/integrase [Bacillota bacterium]
MKDYILTQEYVEKWILHLKEEERSSATLQKYRHDLNELFQWLEGKPITKTMLLEWKECLIKRYAPSSVNSMLAAINSFLAFSGCRNLSVRLLKIQKRVFCDEKRELTRAEYMRLVDAAYKKGNERLALILQTICSTGMRVSELRFVTASAVAAGRAEVNSKGKQRTIFLPDKLCCLLKKYLKSEKRSLGAVFVTRSGEPMNRSNIWREMKKLCKNAGVEPDKVFPHNLRHLFARMYYTMEKDLSRLADILGHSNVNTTRIYTIESGFVHARQIERMGLIVTT